MNRLQALRGTTFDLVIIGGGIIGCGIARDAALRGLSVALFEQDDFASGTTSGSTRIVHGGLRYLEMFDFRLVRLDLGERETLLRIAPHLVKPQEFFIPLYDRSRAYRAKLRAGLILYDALSYDKSLPNHRFLTATEIRSAEPRLRMQGLDAAAAYYDARVDSPERLSLENLIEAREHGARPFNYAEVVASVQAGGTIRGVRVRDVLNGAEVEIAGRVVVNATGPWFDRVAGALAPHPGRMVRTTKGIHIVCPTVSQRALLLFSRVDGRPVFVIPRLGSSWIGPTDTDFLEDPGLARATSADVGYLVKSVGEFFPSLRADEIRFTSAGVRALARREGTPSSVSRMHRIVDGAKTGAPGVVSVVGGKITGYRAIAKEVTDLVCRKIGAKRPCHTAMLPLPGARRPALFVAPPEGLSAETVDHLHALYGSRAGEVLHLAASSPKLQARLAPEYPDIAAQVVFAVRSEQCLRVADLLLRRTLLGVSPAQGWPAVPAVTALMAEELGWSPAQAADETEAYRRMIVQTQRFRE